MGIDQHTTPTLLHLLLGTIPLVTAQRSSIPTVKSAIPLLRSCLLVTVHDGALSRMLDERYLP